MPTLYEVLDVDRDADRTHIKSAFRDRVKAVHPDHSDHPDARDAFERVYTAKEVLTDPAERERYDTMGHADYIRQHEDPALWEVDETPAGSTAKGSTHRSRTTGSTQATRGQTQTSATTAGTGPASGQANGHSRSRHRRSRNRYARRESVVDEDVSWADGQGTWTARQSVPASPAAGRRTDLRRIVGSTQSLVIAGALALFYPAIALGAFTPAFPLVFNAMVLVCLIVIATYLLAIPEFGLAIFGGWGVLGGIGLLLVGPTLPLAIGYLLSTWVPAGLALLTMAVIRY
ncbi:J domain-containing protein [Halococcoides cellulosivorans]|uniref:J domain-containing protein n=1 Tax=Halococcoides cellulosivorans TaxID=1679096 RepID=A0A2R4X244_9EURY|nr:J domain-containing protein [Halococcoides cellulosivorans]AWB27861.1 hypothetical protein HARCEL1_09120 [Halococcoides cellulosivorans]